MSFSVSLDKDIAIFQRHTSDPLLSSARNVAGPQPGGGAEIRNCRKDSGKSAFMLLISTMYAMYVCYCLFIFYVKMFLKRVQQSWSDLFTIEDQGEFFLFNNRYCVRHSRHARHGSCLSNSVLQMAA